jgi:hypothetical protein
MSAEDSVPHAEAIVREAAVSLHNFGQENIGSKKIGTSLKKQRLYNV